MSSYKTNYKDLRQTPEMAAIIEALERGFNKFDIDFYLVGAVARDVWMRAIHAIAPKRTTGDIDFAVLIHNAGTYEALKAYLTEEEGFRSYPGNSFVLLWKNGQEVDLLPFGSIEQDGRVNIAGTGLTTLHVAGFKEVYEAGLPELELENNQKFKFCTIPGIVLLKLIAWDDRPEVRTSDIHDLSDILLNYFQMFADDIYENHNDLFDENDDEDFLIKVAAQVVGREVGKIAVRNKALTDRIVRIIGENTASASSSNIAAIMANFLNNTVEDNLTLLRKIKQGIEESIA